MLNLFFLLVLSGFAADQIVDTRPVCNAKAVTRNCAFFDENSDKALIFGKDGTFLPNPFFSAGASKDLTNASSTNTGDSAGGFGQNTSLGSGSIHESETNRKYTENYLRYQAGVLNALTKSNLSMEAKLSLSLLGLSFKRDAESKFEVPYPLNSKIYSLQARTGKEIDSDLKQLLTPKEYAELLKLNGTYLTNQQKIFIDSKLTAMGKQVALMKMEKNELKKIEPRKNRVLELTNYAKATAIDIITHGKPEAQRNEYERVLVKKIEAISINYFDSTEATTSPNCANQTENAFYSPVDNSITVCPGISMRPDGMLLSILAHEVGHAVDPCHALMGTWKIDQTKLAKYTSSGVRTLADQGGLMELQRLEDKNLYFDPQLSFGDPKIFEDLLQKGIITQTAKGTPSGLYPLRKEYSCLVREEKFQEISKSEITDTEKFLAAYEKNSTSRNWEIINEVKSSKERYLSALKHYPQCFPSKNSRSQMTEVVGDLIGAITVERFQLEHPPLTELDKVGSIPGITSTCTKSTAPTSSNLSPRSYSRFIDGLEKIAHPNEESRISKILINTPGSADLFNCRRKAKNCFDHLSFKNRTRNTNLDSTRTRQ